MKKLLVLGLFATMGLGIVSIASAAPQTRDFRFTCKNDWMQEVHVDIEAESLEAARKMLKIKDEYRSQYNNCSFRLELPYKPKRKAANPDEIEPVNATE